MGSSRKARAADPGAQALPSVVERQVRGHVRAGEVVTVGLSGGVDSIVLVDALQQRADRLRIVVSALHVHHGLSANADAWEAFCRQHCGERGIGFHSVRVAVGGNGANLEAEARHARYAAYRRHGARVVVLAHNRDDQAETVLLRLLRGAGVRGLSAMAPMRTMGAGDHAGATADQILLRPLLTVPRADILDYARSRRLGWVEDESNADPRHARNFLRNEVLPLLDSRFPGSRSSMARAAEQLAAADVVLQALADSDLAAVSDGSGIDVVRLTGLGEARAASTLRRALELRGEAPLPAATTREMLRQLQGAGSDAEPRIVLSRNVVRRFRGHIRIDARAAAGEPAWSRVRWDGMPIQCLPDGSMLTMRATSGHGVSRARLASGTITLRRRSGGESLRLHPGAPRRTLKNLLQERAVPPWQRRGMPLLYCGDQLVWVPMVGVASDFLAEPGEAACEFCWHLA